MGLSEKMLIFIVWLDRFGLFLVLFYGGCILDIAIKN